MKNKASAFKALGGDEKAATVVKSPNRYAAWGALGNDAKKEGWLPVSWNNDTTEYRSQYQNQFNQVVDPLNKQRAYIAAVGGNNNGLFNLYIKDANGNILKELGRGLTGDKVRGYFTNPQSTIAQRVQSVAAGTNPDRMINGTYTPLQ